MRPLSLAWTWWNFRSWSSVALYTLTGTLTRPKAIEPFQMDRISARIDRAFYRDGLSGTRHRLLARVHTQRNIGIGAGCVVGEHLRWSARQYVSTGVSFPEHHGTQSRGSARACGAQAIMQEVATATARQRKRARRMFTR